MASTEIVKYCKKCGTKYQFCNKFCSVCETKIYKTLRTVEKEEMKEVIGFSDCMTINSKKKTFYCHQPKLVEVRY